MADWIFEDFSKNPFGELQARFSGFDGTLDNWTADNLGHIVMLGPREAYTSLNLTGPPGSCSSVYYSLCFQLGKWEMQVQKASEEIEVSPVHAQYYQLTMRQKEELEGKIKAGLASAAQAVSDFELLRHDQRKYQEFKNYYDTKDEHSLRAVFVDQVDIHTGDGISIRSIVSRWPTLISDFMRLAAGDTDVDKVKDKLGVSKAEAVVLVTKNKLYNEWKSLFIKEVEGRLGRIEGLLLSRQRSIDEYREWLKPYVARFKLINQSFESPAARKEESTSFFKAGGHAVSTSKVSLWVWKDFQPTELKRMAPELIGEKPIDPYDNWTKKNVIFHPKWGLVKKYPWIAGEVKPGVMWADEAAKQIKKNWMVPHRLYYGFIGIDFIRSNMRGADGAELEDGTWKVNGLVMSQNALLAKLMELKAKQEEFERYINDLLGIKATPEKVSSAEQEKENLGELRKKLAELKKREVSAEKTEREKAKSEIKGISGKIAEKEKLIGLIEGPREMPKLPLGMIAFRNRGDYERMLEERLTKYFAKAVAENLYVPVVSFLKSKFGYGKP